MKPDDPGYLGQSEYTPFFLKLYDPVVLGFFMRVVWRCPTTLLVERYRRHIRPRHLDVGPGTGYFLEQARLPEGTPVTILDPNANVLDHASRRLQPLDITAVEADVLKPLPLDQTTTWATPRKGSATSWGRRSSTLSSRRSARWRSSPPRIRVGSGRSSRSCAAYCASRP